MMNSPQNGKSPAMKKILLTCLPAILSFNLFSQGVIPRGTIVQYLSGTDKDHTIQWDFYCTGGRNGGRWTKIAVPSNWEQQGFGNYSYGLDKVKANEQGVYRYQFNTPKNAQGKKVFIVFEGSMTDTEVKINGRSAGDIHQGGFYRFKYDITPLLNAGKENLLEVTVSKTSANPSVNKAERSGDFWIFGGIYRPVYLEIVPQTYIDRVAIDAKADGSFRMDVYAQNLAHNDIIEAQVQSLHGENIGKPFSITAVPSLEKQELKSSFTKPLLWSSEFPNRYKVLVSVKNKKGILHSIKQRFGFRTVELRKNDGFYVNGAKILFKGVDRHSFWPETGRTLSHNIHLLDVNLMKEMNMNAVRMSHYPPDQDFIDVCDSLGLYVLDELTGWHGAYDTLAGRKLVREMVVRDVNHPAVVIWDNGNEGGWNRGLDGDYALYDPQQRIVIHPWERFNGTNTKHYPDYNYLVNSVATEQDVFFPTEFMHGLYDGGAGAGLDDFWQLMMKHPHGAGGFIWALLDEAVIRTDKNGLYDTDGNHAPDGILGPHREKEASFYTIKEIWSPVYIAPHPIDTSFMGKIAVENRYSFTNLNQCTFNWKLVTFPSAGNKTTQATITASGAPAPINLAPGNKGILTLNLPQNWAKSDALYLTAYDPRHKELFTWSWAIKDPASFARPATNAASRPATRPQAPQTPKPVEAKNNGDSLTVICDGIQYLFNKKTGYIEKVVKPGVHRAEISLTEGPVLAGVKCDLLQFRDTVMDGRYVIESDYESKPDSLHESAHQDEATFHVKWIFATGQLVKLEYQYTLKNDTDFAGITFNYPEEKITGIKWLGRGPYRVWKNRLKGQQFGVWHKGYNNAVTGEDWQYPEFKGYHAEVNWVVIENRESPFTIYTDDRNMFLQILHPQREKDALKKNNVEPPFPDGAIGFLTGISPIGTKFQAAGLMGPQSQKNHLDGSPVSGVLLFDFR